MYENIIRRAPREAQDRICAYVEELEHEAGKHKEVLEAYGVKSIRELVQHLVEYECGTQYVAEDPIIIDYKFFWEVMNKESPQHNNLAAMTMNSSTCLACHTRYRHTDTVMTCPNCNRSYKEQVECTRR